MSTTSRGPSRRTLVKGAAWSVPVVAVAGAAPAMAASQPVTPPTFSPGSACKFSGGSCNPWKHAYRAVFCMTNNTDEPIVVNITAIRVNDVTRVGQPSQVAVPATGEPFCFYTIADETGDSANGTLEFDYNYTYTDESGASVPISGTASTGNQGLPPCDDCETQMGQPAPAPKSATVAESIETADVKVDEAPAPAESTDAPVEPAPAPAAPVEPAPVPPVEGDGTTDGQNG